MLVFIELRDLFLYCIVWYIFEDGFHVIGGDTTSELAAFSAEQPFAYAAELAVFFFLSLEEFEAFGILLFFRVHDFTVLL